MNKIKLVIIGSIACIAGVLADESRTPAIHWRVHKG